MPQWFSDGLTLKARGFRSLSAKLLSAIFIWAVCLLGFIGFTVLMTWRLEEGGVAINEAGRLNNKIYRLAASAGLAEADAAGQVAAVRQALAALAAHRQRGHADAAMQLIRRETDAFTAAAEQTAAGAAPALPLIAQADALQQRIDEYAQMLEHENTRNIGLLRLVRIALAALILGSALACFVMLRQTVLRPLAVLYGAIGRITRGNLDTRLRLQSRDEFEAVSDGFNQMAANLQDMYAHLEDKVAQKTAELSRQNYEWETLYHITSYLHTHDFGEEVQQDFLARMLTLADLRAGALFWRAGRHFYQGAAQQFDEAKSAALLQWLAGQDGGDGRNGADYADLTAGGHAFRVALFPVRSLGGLRGIMALQTNGREPAPADERLIGLLCTQLGIAQENADLVELKRQHAVLEERNLMAQGLHDSLAQSLSFLNMRFQMLRKHKKLQDDPHVQENIAMIQEGVEYCYEDVRELLENFRTKPVQGLFAETVASVAARYRKQMGIALNLYIVSGELHLGGEQQLQVLFILQEALSNIRKHAAAHTVEVVLDDSGDFSMSVSDDGCGFDTANAAHQGHIGLAVMHERAEKIHADIRIDSRPGQGTRVLLTIPADKR